MLVAEKRMTLCLHNEQHSDEVLQEIKSKQHTIWAAKDSVWGASGCIRNSINGVVVYTV